MDNFDKIIKGKLEQFEVPFNDAHWAEMDGKLESIRIAKIKKTVLGIAAGVIGISLAAYMILPIDSTEKDIAETKESTVIIESNELDNSVKPNHEKEIRVNPIVENNNVVNEDNSDEAIVNETIDTEESTEIAEQNEVNESSSASSEEKSEEINTIENLNSAVIDAEFNPDFIVYNNKVCLGEKVSFEPITTDGPVSYVWNFGDGKISHKTSPSHAYEHSGNYDITLTVIDRQTGKEYTEIKRNQVIILASASATFTYFEESKKYDDNKLKYPYTLFKVKSNCEGCNYKWDMGNGKTAKNLNPKTIYKKDGSYNVTLTTESSNGCISSIERRVIIKDGVNLYAPNTFTPNQDDDNETFIPKALVEWDSQFEMTIVGKTGATVYKTSDKNEPWNGKLNNTGQLMSEGIYFWQVVITDAYGMKHSYQGDIKLMK